MLLSTLECAREDCDKRVHTEADMWHVIDYARSIGWLVDHNDIAWCPEHSPDDGVGEKWVVGCYVCDFEEEYDSEEEAKNEYSMHECESDTWIWDPEKARNMEARRASRRTMETARVNATLSDAAAQQDRIEAYANQWLRIRNFFLPWKKERITSQHPRKG